MFMFKASRYLEELKKFRPDILKACQLSMKDVSKDNDFLRLNESAFFACPSESIDYDIIEKTNDSGVVPMDVGWSDVGSWFSLWDLSEKDSNGNSTHGDIMLHETKNSYIRTDEKLVTAIGVNDLIIVSTKDALMVAHKDSVQNVKIISEKIKSESRVEWEIPREVCRPWGKYDLIDKE